MDNTGLKLKENIRHISIRKKTASRICSLQVLYSFLWDQDYDRTFHYKTESSLQALSPKILTQHSVSTTFKLINEFY